MRVNMVPPQKHNPRIAYYIPPDRPGRVDRRVDPSKKPKNKDHEFLRKMEVTA